MPDERTIYCFIVAVYVFLCAIVIVYLLGKDVANDSSEKPSIHMGTNSFYFSRDKTQNVAESPKALYAKPAVLLNGLLTEDREVSGPEPLRPPPALIYYHSKDEA